MKIALLSDSHSHIDQAILTAIEGVDEIWHAGDVGSWNVIEELQKIAPLRVVYGNIDDHTFRAEYPMDLQFEILTYNICYLYPKMILASLMYC